MKSVAIVGSGTSTMYKVQDSKADEIWSLSWMYDQELYPDVLPRMDRMFELHQTWLFKESENERLSNHWKWLQEEHDFPIYIQEEDPLILSGIKFPFDEINENLLGVFGGRLISLFPDGKEEDDLYYSCTISFMIALAIFEGFDRIEAYGIEMHTTTEFKYQVPGANFMAGLAVGRGIEFVRPVNSTFARSTLYAYDVTQMITGTELEAGLESFKTQQENKVDKMEEVRKKYKLMYSLAQSGKVTPKRITDLSMEVLDAEKRVERCIGAVQSLEWQIKEVALRGMITRSQLDFGLDSYTNQRDKEIAKMNVASGKYQIMFDLAKKDKKQKATMERLASETMVAEKRVERCIGGIQSVEWQIAIIDLKKVEAAVNFYEQFEEVKR